MAPTTAADRMLVTSSMTSSLDWMLTRDSRRRPENRPILGVGSTSVCSSVVVDAPLRPVDQGGMGVLSQEIGSQAKTIW